MFFSEPFTCNYVYIYMSQNQWIFVQVKSGGRKNINLTIKNRSWGLLLNFQQVWEIWETFKRLMRPSSCKTDQILGTEEPDMSVTTGPQGYEPWPAMIETWWNIKQDSINGDPTGPDPIFIYLPMGFKHFKPRPRPWHYNILLEKDRHSQWSSGTHHDLEP